MRSICTFILLIFIGLSLYPQSVSTDFDSPTVDLDSYYRYPFSFGIAHYFQLREGLWGDSLIYLTDNREYSGGFVGVFRWTIEKAPFLQPILRLRVGGIPYIGEIPAYYFSDGTQVDVAGGLGVSHRFSKVLEAGIDVYGGYAHLTFRALRLTYDRSASAPSAFTGTGINFVVSPIFNLSISLSPRVEYHHSLLGIESLTGFIGTLELAFRFRIGQDPDRDTGGIRSIRFGTPEIQPLFAAMQSYYTTHPVGSVVITNIDDHPIEDVEVSFYQQSLMDGPTPAASIDILQPEEEAVVDFPASFNAEVFETEGVTPLTGEIIVNYRSSGKPAEQRRSITFDLYDKSSLTWDDDRKMGAFITPSDNIVRSYASTIRQAHKEVVIPALNDELQFAIQAYNALAANGLLYQPDPALPFSGAQEDRTVVDSVNLPRDTLQRITGDCDDITALYASLLESIGIETALLTTPGHIYVAFDTKTREKDFAEIHPDRDMLIFYDNEVWVPVEITMIGKEGFLEAWRYGKREFDAYEGQPEQRGFYRTREAHQLFRPVGLRTSEQGLDLEVSGEVVDTSVQDADSVAGLILERYRVEAQESGRSRDYNRYGIMASRLHQFSEAEYAFEKVVELADRNLFTMAYSNLGSMYFLMGKYEEALDSFERARVSAVEAQVPGQTQAKVLINMAKTCYELERYSEADRYYDQAVAIDPEAAGENVYLASASGVEGRASGPGEQEVLFIEVE